MRQRLRTVGSLFATTVAWTLLFLVGTLGVYIASCLCSEAPLEVRYAFPAFQLTPQDPAETSLLDSMSRYGGGARRWMSALFADKWQFWLVLGCFSLFVALVADRMKR